MVLIELNVFTPQCGKNQQSSQFIKNINCKFSTHDFIIQSQYIFGYFREYNLIMDRFPQVFQELYLQIGCLGNFQTVLNFTQDCILELYHSLGTKNSKNRLSTFMENISEYHLVASICIQIFLECSSLNFPRLKLHFILSFITNSFYTINVFSMRMIKVSEKISRNEYESLDPVTVYLYCFSYEPQK